jgi:hypothetical protein
VRELESISDGAPSTSDTTVDWTGDPTTVAVGGLASGTVVSGMTLSQLLYEITHPFVAPTLSMIISDDAGTFAKNTTKSISTINLTSSGGSVGAFANAGNPITLYNNGTVINSSAYTVTINSATSATITFHTPIALDGTVDTTINVTVSVNSHLVSVSKSYTFVITGYTVYYGGSSTNTLTAADITAGTSASLSAKAEMDYKFTISNGYSFMAYPASWGELSTILDQNGFNITSDYTLSQVTINSTSYNVYVSADPSTISNFTIKFQF